MDYRVKPIGKTCARTGEALTPGQTVHSVLVMRGGETVRLDFSEAGWDGPPEDAIGTWKACVPPQDDDQPKRLDAESLLEHFQRLVEDANPAHERMCYLMALLLLQKRRLSLDGSRVDGDVVYLQLCGSRGEGPFDVRDLQLTAEEIAALQAHLTEHLERAA
jgi:hypothetical protein